ncbi:acetyl-CoA synthetase-like protein [Polyplosphaeria fusca]|uniref:Very long-chain fatty acid transport protein n=1 Tax=Polyplosphaeria fusca TaxID=682080 RepID=A0A9P4RDF0_9PLEO|nr:acetyl-CoA synthetase-like protein [Polyplosphaeria fusca]
MQALPYAVPAAAALAYLNGRHAFTYDWSLLSSLISGSVSGALSQKRDDLNLFNILESHARSSRRDHTWIMFEGRSWSYAEAHSIVLKYGTWLKERGVEKNEVVAMDFWNSELFIWVWFGLWSIGAKPAFINYNLTGKPLLHTIKTSTARLVLVDENGRGKFTNDVMTEHGLVARPGDAGMPEGRQAKFEYEDEPEPLSSSPKQKVESQIQEAAGNSQPQSRKLEIIFFDQGLENYIQSLDPVRQPDSVRQGQKLPDMAMLIYTSGTTGLPKPAVVSWSKAYVGGKFISGFLNLKRDDIVHTSMPLYHSAASVLGLGAVLCAGVTMCLSKKFSHKTFWTEVRASKATVIHYVGETCRYLLAAPKSPLDKEHNVRLAWGNGLRPDVWEPFKQRFGIPTIVELYGATEGPGALFNRSTNTFSTGAIGRNGTLAELVLGRNLEVVRLDPESGSTEPVRDAKTGLCQVTEWSEPGELLHKLDPADINAKFQGYFGNSKATNSKVLRDVRKKGDAYFRTGDMMKRDQDGRWFFVDRLGDTFRWKSENVSTAEVSDVIGKHDAIEEAAVYGVLVPRHDGRAGCVAATLKDNQAPHAQTLKSLADHVSKNLPRFAVPLFLRVTKEMHKTGTNKYQKHVFQKDGILVDQIEQTGDVLFWLKDGTYERFTAKDLQNVEGGGVKL